MRTVNIHAAKTHLSRLVEDAAAGEEIIIAKSGKPVARLCPLAELKKKRVLGFSRRKNSGTGGFRHDVRGRDPSDVRRRMLMRILLDTHILIWAAGSSRRLDVKTLNTLGLP